MVLIIATAGLLAAGLLWFFHRAPALAPASRVVLAASPERPFAVEVVRGRSLFHARNVVERLRGQGVESYVVRTGEGESGDWHVVMSGGFATVEEQAREMERLRLLLSLDSMKPVQFDPTQQVVVQDDGEELRFVPSRRPDLPAEVFDLVSYLPDAGCFDVVSGGVFRAEPAQRIDFKFDWPRGIDRRWIDKVATLYAGITFEDNLYGDNIVLTVLRLRSDAGDALLEEAARRIVDTDKYEKEVIEDHAVGPFEGKRVSILLRARHKRPAIEKSYLLLRDRQRGFVVFSESRRKTPEKLDEILSGLGRGRGLLDHPEFYNSLYSLPSQLLPGDRFLGFALSRLGWPYVVSKGRQRWAQLLRGHWAFSSYFVNDRRGRWWFEAFDVLTPTKSKSIYDIYERMLARNATDRDVMLGHVRGHFLPAVGRPLNELNYRGGRYWGMVGSRGTMPLSELQPRAMLFQLDISGPSVSERVLPSAR